MNLYIFSIVLLFLLEVFKLEDEKIKFKVPITT